MTNILFLFHCTAMKSTGSHGAKKKDTLQRQSRPSTENRAPQSLTKGKEEVCTCGFHLGFTLAKQVILADRYIELLHAISKQVTVAKLELDLNSCNNKATSKATCRTQRLPIAGHKSSTNAQGHGSTTKGPERTAIDTSNGSAHREERTGSC